MPKVVNYKPDAGKQSLQMFYDWLDSADHKPTGLLGEVVSTLENVYKGPGKVRSQIGTWASFVDPYLNNKRELDSRLKTLQGSIVKDATYSEILKKLLFLIKTKQLNRGLRTGWLTKFTDPTSPYFCSYFVDDVKKVDRVLGNAVGVNNEQQMKWFITLVRLSGKHPYLNKKFEQKHKDAATKKYPLGLYKPSPLEMFRKFCLPENKHYNPMCFEQSFAAIKYKVDGNNPDESVKELILRVLDNGHYIDCPTWNHFLDGKGKTLSNENLWFWFDRYTNKDSAYYDAAFDSLLKEKHPQQYTDKSLTFEGLRCYDKKKQEILDTLEKDPTHKFGSGVGVYKTDPIFKQKFDDILQKNGLLKDDMEDVWAQRKKEMLDLLKSESILEETNKSLFKWFVRLVKESDILFDKDFVNQVNEVDPWIVKHIQKEWSNDNPFRPRFEREYKKERYNLKDELWFAVEPCWQIMDYLDYENSKRTGYKSPVDPSVMSYVRKTGDYRRDNIRKVYEEVKGKPCDYKKEFGSFRNQRSLPYTFNIKDETVIHTGNTLEEMNFIAKDNFVRYTEQGTPYVPRKRTHAGWILFKAAIEPTEDSVVEYLKGKMNEQ